MKRKTAIKKLMGIGHGRNSAAELLDAYRANGYGNSTCVNDCFVLIDFDAETIIDSARRIFDKYDLK